MKKILQRATQTNYFPIFLCTKKPRTMGTGLETIKQLLHLQN